MANSSPQDRLPGDLFGPGWVKVDEWPVEPEAGAATSCPESDAVVVGAGHRWNEALWTRDETRLSYRVAEVGSEARSLVDAAGAALTACPSVELGGTEVKVSPLSLGIEHSFKLSALPIRDGGTASLVLNVDTGSEAWLIVQQHKNVVSVLTVEDDGSLDDAAVAGLAVTATENLVAAAPYPGSSTTERQQPNAAPGAATSALLTFDSEECRNVGTVEAFGVVWELVDPVPLDWQGTSPSEGTLTIVDDENATFARADGTELRVTIGANEQPCFGWDDEGG